MKAGDRPTAKQIVDGVVVAFLQSREPLDEGLLYGPTNFDVYLHPRALDDLRPIVARLESQARMRLDGELERQNRQRDMPGRLFRAIIVFVKRLLYGGSGGTSYFASGYTRTEVQGKWQITFNAASDAHNDIGFLAIDTDFAPTTTNAAGVTPTVPLIHRTIQVAPGEFQTRLVRSRVRSHSSGIETTLRNQQEGVPLARISYADDKGPKTYVMNKVEITIGRMDEQSDADLRLDVVPDVSRVHLAIRLAPSGEFQIRDTSKFGVTVDGSRITNGEWVPLPRRSWIGLAGVVDMKFEAVP